MKRGAFAAAAFVVLAVFATAACDRDEVERVKLDGSPRHPDVAGVVASVSTSSIRIKGEGEYEIRRDLQSFASQTMQAVPVLQRKGQYVHVGVSGNRAVWVAAVGSVVEGDEPVVYYPGTVKAVDGREVVFNDGTVLRLAPKLAAPAAGAKVVAEIDPATNLVRAIPPA